MPQPYNLGPQSDTVNGRRIIAGVTVTSAPPTLATQGFNAGPFNFINIWAKSTGGTSAVLKIWQLSTLNNQWAYRSDIGAITVTSATDGGTAEIMIETRNASRLYVQVSAITGATLDAWAEGFPG